MGRILGFLLIVFTIGLLPLGILWGFAFVALFFSPAGIGAAVLLAVAGLALLASGAID